jgi:hypothetical protein
MTVNYTFNNLATGNLNGKDNWVTTKHNTAVDMMVTSAAGYDLTNALTFSQSGPSVGVDASKNFGSMFSNTAFSSTASTYIISFDLLRSYWGVNFVIGADINNDGKITKTDVAEKAVSFTSGSQPGETLTLPNGTVLTYPSGLTNAWTTVEITLSNFNSSASGKITIRTKVLGTSTWNTLTNNINLGIDTTTNDKKNPNLWKMFFIHFEGASGKLDNISATRIGPQIITSVAESKVQSEILIYPNPAKEVITLVTESLNANTYFTLYDVARREVEKVLITNTAQQLSLPALSKGIYYYQVRQTEGLLKTGKLVIE